MKDDRQPNHFLSQKRERGRPSYIILMIFTLRGPTDIYTDQLARPNRKRLGGGDDVPHVARNQQIQKKNRAAERAGAREKDKTQETRFVVAMSFPPSTMRYTPGDVV